MADDGGSSGRLRRDLGLPPPGDLRMALLALAGPDAEARELFGYRFQRGDLAGHNLGNLILASLADLRGDFLEALATASRWLRVRGRVLPSTLAPVRLLGRVEGQVVEGQVAIRDAWGRVDRVWLEPRGAAALPEAVAAVREAALVLLGPGSICTSVVPNLLLPELGAAVAAASERVVYLCNLEPQPGETSGFSPEAHLAALLAHCPGLRVPLVLAERVERVLAGAGILDGAGRLTHGVPGALVRGRDAAACYLRGAFLGRGSVSAPTREPHFEVGAPDERTAAGLAALLARFDLPARVGVRADQDLHRVLLKGREAIGRALATMGASSAYLAWEDGRIRREVRGEAVRLANADHANLRRSVAAAMAQVAMVEAAVAALGWEALPPGVADVAALRLANPEASLAELGALLDPPRSKGAVLARLRRLEGLSGRAEENT